MQFLLIIGAMVLAAILGAAAHRASICTVAAVEEVFDARRADMLVSFLKAAIWVIVVTIVLDRLAREFIRPPDAWQLSWSGLIGGVVFGIGAAINGGCAISTLRKLSSGRIVMAGALLGFCLGLVVYRFAEISRILPQPAAGTPVLNLRGVAALVLLAALGVWILWEIRLMLRRRTGAAPRQIRRYRLSVAAALMGVCNGILFALLGAWMYTGILRRQIDHVLVGAMQPKTLCWLLFVALLAGMSSAAVRMGNFHVNWGLTGWARHVSGGALMGLGAASIPGGNDVVLLHGIPGFSPHALPVFLAILAGIAVTLGTRRMVRR